MAERVAIHVRVRPEVHRRLRHLAVERGQTNAEIVSQAIDHLTVCAPIGDHELAVEPEVTEVIERGEVGP